MINIRHISNAFLNYAEKQNNYEQLIQNLITFKRLYNKNGTIKSLILSKRISIDNKNKILTTSIGSIINTSIIEFVIYLANDKSIKYFSKIVNQIENNFKERKGVINVDVISAIDLNSNLINDISDYIKNIHSKKAIINKIIDKKLIAGIKLRIGNTIVDGTISNKLKNLKNNIINNSN